MCRPRTSETSSFTTTTATTTSSAGLVHHGTDRGGLPGHGPTAHLDRLTTARDGAGDAADRLAAVLHSYAEIAREPHERHGAELVASLHASAHVARAHDRLRRLVHDALVDAVASGQVRDDVAVEELVDYCLHALSAARNLTSPAAVRRLVTVTLAGLRPAP
jgi:hypothetical protein